MAEKKKVLYVEKMGTKYVYSAGCHLRLQRLVTRT